MYSLRSTYVVSLPNSCHGLIWSFFAKTQSLAKANWGGICTEPIPLFFLNKSSEVWVDDGITLERNKIRSTNLPIYQHDETIYLRTTTCSKIMNMSGLSSWGFKIRNMLP